MNKVSIKLSLAKSIQMTFFLLSLISISDKVFSRDHWERDCLRVLYNKNDNSIGITQCEFINYEFGPFGQHAYWEWLNIAYSTDGLHYVKLMRCEVEDQVHIGTSWMTFTDKLQKSKIDIHKCIVPTDGSSWVDNTKVRVKVKNSLDAGLFTIIWYVPSNIKVKNLLLTGVWHVNGIYCNDEIDGEIYEVNPLPSLVRETVVKPDSLHNHIFLSEIIHSEKMDVKVYKDADSVLIKGVDFAENIKVYTSTGTLVNSVVANEDVVKIKLPTNQIYIVKVGHARHKVAL